MDIRIGEKTITPEYHPEITSAIWGASSLVGVSGDSEELNIRGNAVDLYLLAGVITMRLAVGDLELVEKRDSLQKKAYQEKLMAEVRRDWCSPVRGEHAGIAAKTPGGDGDAC